MTYEEFKTAALDLLASQKSPISRDALRDLTIGQDDQAAEKFDEWVGMLEAQQLVRSEIVQPQSRMWDAMQTIFDIEEVACSITAKGRIELSRIRPAPQFV